MHLSLTERRITDAVSHEAWVLEYGRLSSSVHQGCKEISRRDVVRLDVSFAPSLLEHIAPTLSNRIRGTPASVFFINPINPS